MATSPKMLGKENSFEGDCDSKVGSENLTSFPDENKSKKMKRQELKELCNANGDHDASLNKTGLKKPKTLKEPSKKTVKGNYCLSDEKNLNKEVQIGDHSSLSKGKEVKCAKNKRGVLNGAKALEDISKKTESTTSDEESRKKMKSKEKSVASEKNLKRQVLETNTIFPVKKKKWCKK